MMHITIEVKPIEIHVHGLSELGELKEILTAIARSIHHLKEITVATNEELVADINAVTAKIAKIGSETSATLQKVADL